MNLDELIKKIKYHKYLYEQGTPEIVDSEYDALLRELQLLEPNNPLIFEAGVLLTYGKRVEHHSIMGSLAKCNALEEFNKWKDTCSMVASYGSMPKIDGCAIELNYERGQLELASTRGDGVSGIDVTHIFKAVPTVPNVVGSYTGRVRGEAYIPKNIFESKREGEFKNLKNPRNAAAGTVNSKDPNVAIRRGLDFIAYDVIPNDKYLENEVSKRKFVVEELGMKYVDVEFHHTDCDWQEVYDKYEEKRKDYPYGIDGVVIKVDSVELQTGMGWTGMCPDFAIAWKFKPEQAEAVVKSISWDIGRTGRITPVAEIEPVDLDGSTISRLSVHNIEEVERMGLSVGAEILIEKAGDIIPQVVKVLVPGLGSINLPEGCPTCNSEIIKEGAYLMCGNPSCTSKLSGRIFHFLQTLGIKGIGQATIVKLIENNLVSSLKDMYFLDKDQIERMEGFGDTSAQAVVDGVLGVSEVPLAKFLSALGLDAMGNSTSEIVANKFETLDEVITASESDLTALQGIGDSRASNIVNGIITLKDEIIALSGILDVLDAKKIEGSLTGLSFCVTGTLSRGRKAVQEDIKEAGGEVKSSVGKSLDYLVAGENAGSKIKKAEKYGVKVIDEKEFLKILRKK